MILYYIRHGDPIYSPDSLTPLGERQAEAVGRRLASHGIDKIFASSSNRAQLTARPTAELLNKEITVLDWANEGIHFGEASKKGSTWLMHIPEYRRLFASDEVRALGKEWYTHEAFRDHTIGVGIKRIQRESDAFLKELGYEHDRENNCYIPTRPNSERIALFAHQGFGVAFLSAVLDIPYPYICTSFDIGHSCVTAIEFGEQVFGCNRCDFVIPRVLTFSNDSHFWKDGLPTSFGNSLYI